MLRRERTGSMNELLKVNAENQTVSARDLHDALEATERFSTWFERFSVGFVEGEDYTTVNKLTQVQNNGGIQERVLTDHECSVDMAKHICLMSRTEKGKECRQYLIDLEKAWNTPEQVMARALKLADQTIASLNKTIETMKPKVEFFEAVTDSKDAISMADVAKVLDFGGGRNTLFKILRQEKILQKDNRPYQEYIDRGFFRVVEQKYDKGYGETGINIKTLVFQKGVEYIRKLLVKREFI